MVRSVIDKTANESLSVALAKIDSNFSELYTGGTAAGVNSALTSLTGLATLTTSGLATENSLKLDTGTKTATATGGAATLAKSSGVITSEAITTAAGATYTLTLTNSLIAAADQVFASVSLGAGTGGTPAITSVTPASGSVAIIVQNIHASAAFNAAIKISFMVLKN